MVHSILIVEDEASSRLAMLDYFRSSGFEVDGAADRPQAEAMLARNRYSLVITDLRLGPGPNLEGLDVVSAARTRCPSTRIVVLTAFGTLEIEQEALKRGADRFIEKDRPLDQVARIALDMLPDGTRRS